MSDHGHRSPPVAHQARGPWPQHFRRSPIRRRKLMSFAGAMALLVATAAATLPANAAPSGACGPTQLFVAPGGDDSAKGSQSAPWRTVEHARDYIASHRLNQHMRCDIDVNLRAGDYPVDQTISFTGADSGGDGHQVVYRSYDGPGKARLLGAKKVTGWQPYQGNIYRAQIGTSQPIHTLFEGDQRATTARYPNRGTDETWAPYCAPHSCPTAATARPGSPSIRASGIRTGTCTTRRSSSGLAAVGAGSPIPTRS